MKCNLQDSRGGKCQNCYRNNLECVIRTGPRSGRLAAVLQSSVSTQALNIDGGGIEQGVSDAILSPARSDEAVRGLPSAESMPRTIGSSSYVGAHTLLGHEAVTDAAPSATALSRITPQAKSLLQYAEATVLPKPPLLAALTESYFNNVFHRYPVTDRTELEDPACSTLLKQAVCMAGSLMRHSSRSDGLEFSHSLYEKTKLMLLLNHDSKPVAILAALCLMICWSPNPTDSLSLDCPWQWTGTSIRLALQMGLHKETTYLKHPEPGRLRRMWWILMV